MKSRSTFHLSGTEPENNLAFEQAQFERSRDGFVACCLFYRNNPCIIMGRNNKPEDWVDTAIAEVEGIPVLRRISGGGAVYHDLDTLNYSFIAPKAVVDGLVALGPLSLSTSKYIDFFRKLVIRALSPLGADLAPARTSDINLNGRKISGNAQRIASRVILHHGTLLTRCPLGAYEKYLPVPPDRPGVAHREFVTGLHEEGLEANLGLLKAWLAAEFWRSIG